MIGAAERNHLEKCRDKNLSLISLRLSTLTETRGASHNFIRSANILTVFDRCWKIDSECVVYLPISEQNPQASD